MVSSKATTVAAYLASLPADRRAAISTVRDVVNKNLPAGYVEEMQYGMIGWAIPLSVKPDTYNKQPLGVAALASQKNHMALYLFGMYGMPGVEAWFRTAFKRAGKTLDMGKSCVRFSSLDALPLDVIGEVITKVPPDKLIAMHDKVHGTKKPAAKKKQPAAAKKKQPATRTSRRA